MARREARTLIDRLRALSEDGIASFFSEVMANENLRRQLGRAGERLTANKHIFDRNVETVLDFVNIPSKRDIRELKSRIDHLNSQFANLSLKVDRLLEPVKPPPARGAGRGPAKGRR
ncbi:MAG TPA: phasin family protein [Candidatus Binataceae bacterium]|nr:phasin family protein [Candidatus Binataceae bacterium]